MTIAEKIAYLKGMFEGMDLNTEKSKEARLIGSILDVLEQLSGELADMDQRFDAVEEEIDGLYDELPGLDLDDDDLSDDEEDGLELECPNCGEMLYVDDETLEEGVIQCPSCERKFVLDLDGGDGCGCGCEGEQDGCCHGHDHGHHHHDHDHHCHHHDHGGEDEEELSF